MASTIVRPLEVGSISTQSASIAGRTTTRMANFAATLSEATGALTSSINSTSSQGIVRTSPQSGGNSKADFVSGRIGLDLNARGVPARVVYFDESGNRLTTSSFNAERILKMTEKFGIDLNDLTGLGKQLDAAGVGYRPYELYRGTGSDHGINFADLISGGLGTAYDWRKDGNVHLKGPTALSRLNESQAFAERRGVIKNAMVTTERGIAESRSVAQSATGNMATTTNSVAVASNNQASMSAPVSTAQGTLPNQNDTAAQLLERLLSSMGIR